jgi:hypothetical protein
MRSRMQHLLSVTSTLLVLVVLLSGPALPATAREARQEPPMQVVQGSGDFPRLPVVAPGAVRAWSVLTDCPAFLHS